MVTLGLPCPGLHSPRSTALKSRRRGSRTHRKLATPHQGRGPLVAVTDLILLRAVLKQRHYKHYFCKCRNLFPKLGR